MEEWGFNHVICRVIAIDSPEDKRRKHERYDRVIKKKSYIANKIGLTVGVMTSLIICTLLVFVPEKKYIGYDSTNYKSIYKDNIEKILNILSIFKLN